MWRCAGAQVVGASHERSSKPCQDSMAYEVLDGTVFLAVIADGAGSASHAELGSRCVVDTVINETRILLTQGDCNLRDILRTAITAARESLVRLAADIGIALRELSTTVLAVLIGPHDGIAMQVGDGLIAVSEEPSDWIWVIWPQHGEFINTTTFLTDDEAIAKMEEAPLGPSVMDISICSDGLENLALNYSERIAHSPFFAALLKELHPLHEVDELSALSNQLRDFIGSDRIRSRSDDDISIIIATRR